MKFSLPRYQDMLRHIRPHLTLNNGVLLVAMVVAVSWVWSTIDAIGKNFRLQQQVDNLQQQIAVSELENKTLEFQKKYYESPEYLELSARERLNKASPGEKLLMLPANSVRPVTEERINASQVPIAERSNFAQWVYFLFGNKG